MNMYYVNYVNKHYVNKLLLLTATMDNVNLGGLDPRKAELLEARFYGRVCFVFHNTISLKNHSF